MQKMNAEDDNLQRCTPTDHQTLSVVWLQVRLCTGLMTPISFLTSVLSYWTCDLKGRVVSWLEIDVRDRVKY